MGALVNFGTIIVGGLLGILLKRKIKQELTDLLITSMSICLIFVAIIGIIPRMITITSGEDGGFLIESHGTLCLIISLFLGTLIGHFLKINDNLDKFGVWVQNKFKLNGFSEGFVSSTLFFCVGAMAILGAIQEGVYHKYDILICKSVIDFTVAIALSASLGYGVIFSAIPILLYEGGLTLCAKALQGVLTTEVGYNILNGVCMVGYAIIFAIALSMMKIKKIKTGDLIPAMLIPIIYYLILSLTNFTDF